MNAREAAWSLHLENVQLRQQVANLRTELDYQRRRAERYERLHRAAAKKRDELRTDLWKAQVRNLVRS